MGGSMRAGQCWATVLVALVGLHAHADVIPPGARTIPRCFTLENLDEHPDYAVVVYFLGPWGGHRVAQPGDCITVDNKYRRVGLYAVERSALEQLEIPEERKAEARFFEAHSALMRADASLEGSDWVREDDPRVRVSYTLRIAALSPDTGFVIEKQAVTYHYADGTRETRTFADQAVTPVPSRPVLPLPSFDDPTPGERLLRAVYVALPAAALVATILVVFRRRRSRD